MKRRKIMKELIHKRGKLQKIQILREESETASWGSYQKSWKSYRETRMLRTVKE